MVALIRGIITIKKNPKRATPSLIAATAVLVIGGLCSIPAGGESEKAESRFGIDYVFPMMPLYQNEIWAKMYAQTKAGWVNFAGVSWNSIEPTKPRGNAHTYHWKDLDRSVGWWQKYDANIVISLRLGNGWFAGPIRYRPNLNIPFTKLWLQGSDRLPADEYMDDYRAWIKALVERYDGDGQEDMPGLKHPLLYYQVGNEYSNPAFWTGTLEDYETLLKETRAAARSAHAEVKIVSNGIRWNDLFHNDPEAELFEERFTAFLAGLPSNGWREVWQRHREFTEGTIALASHYDILDAGGNGPYPTMSQGYITWVRQELAKSGLTTTIWDMEARSEPILIVNDRVTFHPELQVPNGEKILQAIKSNRHAGHQKAVAWYRAEQARILVKVFVMRFAAGFEKVFMGMASDWDGTLGARLTANPYLGLLDSQGKPWAAFYALKLLAEKTDGFSHAEKMNSNPGVELYRFRFQEGRPAVWVVWLSEDKVQGMDDPLPRVRVPLKDIRRPALLWETPTSAGDPKPVRLEVSSQPVIVDLTPTPVIIQEETRR